MKHARKAIPSAGIEVGQPYYWWKFRFGGKHVSKTYPKQSQLTQSEFLSQMYDINDRLQAVDADNAADEVAEIISELEDIASELVDKLGNMFGSLQYSPTGELLQERIDAVNDMASELENIDTDVFGNVVDEPEEPETEEPDEADYEAYESYATAQKEWEEAEEAYEEAKAEYEDWVQECDSALEEIQAISYEGS